MRNLYFLLGFILISLVSFGQQEPQFSHNMFNMMDINPGYAGSEIEASSINDPTRNIKQFGLCGTLLHRQQWIGFKDNGDALSPSYGYNGAPQTTLLSLDAPVNPLHGGIGFTLMKDKLGFEDNINIKLAYAFRMAIGPGSLGIGAQVGFMNKKIDFSKFYALDVNDPVLSTGKEATMFTDFALGFYYKIPQKLYFGIAMPQLSENQKALDKSKYKLKRHYYINGGYYLPLGNPDLLLNPSVFIKTDLVSTQFDLNALLWYKEAMYGGLSYRQTDAIVILFGFKPFYNSQNKYLKDLLAGVSYDITTSSIGSKGRSYGTVEVMLHYCFKFITEKPPQSYRNVLHL